MAPNVWSCCTSYVQDLLYSKILANFLKLTKELVGFLKLTKILVDFLKLTKELVDFLKLTKMLVELRFLQYLSKYQTEYFFFFLQTVDTVLTARL